MQKNNLRIFYHESKLQAGKAGFVAKYTAWYITAMVVSISSRRARGLMRPVGAGGAFKMYFYCEKCKKKYPINSHSYQCGCGGMFKLHRGLGEE
jgi:hypothetical protein